MKIVTGYIWALWWWRTSDPSTRVIDCTCKLRSLDGCRDGMTLLHTAGIDRLRDIGVARGIPASIPLEVVTNDRVGHASSSLCVRHTAKGEVPSGVLCPIDNGIYVFTPAYCLLQISSIAPKRVSKEVDSRFAAVAIAKVAGELCGQYSLADRGGFVKRLPLVTVGELAALSIEMSRTYGASLLRSVIPWVVPNTRSPKETDLSLLLCLPPDLGGYGLPRPLSNFDLSTQNAREGFFAGWDVCNVDFYWPQARLIVEYDSREHHEDVGAEKVEYDRARARALEELGYRVVTITRNQLYSLKQFQGKAIEVARALAFELPEQTASFREANNTLRMMLLRHDRWF